MTFQIFRFIILPLSAFLVIIPYTNVKVSAWSLVNVSVQHTFEENFLTVSDLMERYMIPPPNASVPLNLKWPYMKDMSQLGQSWRIQQILDNMRNGFYIECGAFDGEKFSNTILLERSYNWTGLLIEPDPKNYAKLVKKNRKAIISNTCLSVRPYPMTVLFQQEGAIGKISEENLGASPKNKVVVQCFPLLMYLQGIKRTTIDYFSLDVEGSELDVLRTIPWDRLNIRVLSVEYTHGREAKEVMRSYMEEKGYFVHSRIPYGPNTNSDFIFVKAT